MMDYGTWVFGLGSCSFVALFLAQIHGCFSGIKDPVAKLLTASGTVRHLPRDFLVWDRVKSGKLLGIGDTISIGAYSKGSLKFFSEDEIEFGANTMFVLRKKSSQVFVEVFAGRERMQKKSKNSNTTIILKKLNESPNETSESSEFISQISREETSVKTTPTTQDLLTLALPKILDPVRFSSPLLDSPPNGAIIDFDKTNSFRLSWQVPQYKRSPSHLDQKLSFVVVMRTLQAKTVLSKEVHHEFMILGMEDIQAGHYIWSVRALGLDGTSSALSPHHRLEVRQRTEPMKPVIYTPIFENEN